VTAQRIADGPPYSHAEARVTPALSVVLALALSTLLAASPAVAQDPSTPPGLTVAILDPAEVPELAPWFTPDERNPTWRTTFGSEREAQHEMSASFGEGLLSDLSGVDVVLLQGVHAAAPLRRLFPPRAWRLIISRNILAAGDPSELGTGPTDLQAGAAIAVKVSKDLRLTGRSLTLRLPKPGAVADDTDSSVATVRLTAGGRTFWLGSIALPPSCSVEDPPCPTLQTLDAWRDEKRRKREPALIGGRIAAQPAPATTAETPVSCASYSIDSDLLWQRVPRQEAGNSSSNTTRCISVIRVTE
jgi:hypothetical protein